ncbi:TVP38/TMEM64 family protein [Rossellomorea vietnamensis]|uniref:TVP38/TMEM64 family protein n=1 Tax=Rossellomorea vietnamensis TaxID=218284 RepID=UPI003CF7531F
MRQLISILLSAVVILIAFTQKEILVEFVKQGGTAAIIISILFVSSLVFFPVVPYPVLAGLIGSMAGIANGTVISLTGILLGSTLMFYLSRLGFRDQIQKILRKYPKASEYESLFERNAFLSILFVRLVPVIPSPVVNIMAGLSRVKISVFLGATSLGKLPAVITFTWAGSVMNEDKMLSFIIYGVYFLLFLFVATLYYYRNYSSLRIDKEEQVNP